MPTPWIVRHHPEPGAAPELWLCSSFGRAKARAKAVVRDSMRDDGMGAEDAAEVRALVAAAESEVDAWAPGDASTSYDGSGRVLAHPIEPDEED